MQDRGYGRCIDYTRETAVEQDSVIDPSPAHQAIEQVCAEYEQTIAELRAEIEELRQRLAS